MKIEHSYKEHRITLTVGQKDDDSWACMYLIVHFGKSESAVGHSGSVTAATEEDAKRGALLEAQKWIDSRT